MADYFPYNPKLKVYAQKLRKESTLAEILLWQRISQKQVLGYDFDRQKPIGNYIVDFFCVALRLAIEIDGSTHWEKEKYDEIRLGYLKKLGITVLIFGDYQVKSNINGVVSEITEKAHSTEKTPRLNPPRRSAPPLRRRGLY